MELDGPTLAIIIVAVPVIVSTFFDGLAKVVRAWRGEPEARRECKKQEE